MFNVSIDSDGKIRIRPLNSESFEFKQSFHYYETYASGAYVFRPSSNNVKDFPAVKSFKTYEGKYIIVY